MVTYLDLALMIKPCASGSRYREEADALARGAGGAPVTCPFLVDEATGMQARAQGQIPHRLPLCACARACSPTPAGLRACRTRLPLAVVADSRRAHCAQLSGDSKAICEYLLATFGAPAGVAQLPPPSEYFHISAVVTGWLPALFRPGRGTAIQPGARTQPPPPQPLVLYSYGATARRRPGPCPRSDWRTSRHRPSAACPNAESLLARARQRCALERPCLLSRRRRLRSARGCHHSCAQRATSFAGWCARCSVSSICPTSSDPRARAARGARSWQPCVGMGVLQRPSYWIPIPTPPWASRQTSARTCSARTAARWTSHRSIELGCELLAWHNHLRVRARCHPVAGGARLHGITHHETQARNCHLLGAVAIALFTCCVYVLQGVPGAGSNHR